MKLQEYRRALLPLLPVAAIALLLLWRVDRLEHELDHLATQAVAQRLVTAFDAELRRSEAALRALGASPRLTAEDWRGLHAEARAMAPLMMGNNIVVFDDRGWQRLNTLLPADAALPARPATPQELLAVFRQPDAVLSNIFEGPITGTWLSAIGVPAGRGGASAFGVGIGISPDQISRVLESAGLPEGWIAAALDRRGVIGARKREAARFVGEPAVAALLEAIARRPDGVLDTSTKEGLDVSVAYRRIERFGWTVAVASPRGPVTTQRVLRALPWLGALLVGVGLGLAWRQR